jgi:hypothetical protein
MATCSGCEGREQPHAAPVIDRRVAGSDEQRNTYE